MNTLSSTSPFIVQHLDNILSWRDLLLTPIFIGAIYLFAYIYYRKNLRGLQSRNFFFSALSIRFLGCFFSALMYQFFYDGGDTYDYWRGALNLKAALFTDPILALKLFTLNEFADVPLEGLQYTNWTFYLYQDIASIRVVQVGGLLSILTFGSYLSTGMILASFSFLGCWKLYQVFLHVFPLLQKQMAIAILFVPSVFFWGSAGLLKDTITTGAFGFFIWAFFNLFIQKRVTLKSIIYLLISGYLLLTIKIYILLALVPALLLWYVLIKLERIRNRSLRKFAKPVFFIGLFIVSFSGLFLLGNASKKYRIDNVVDTAAGAQEWMKYVGDKSGTGYDLGEYDKSLIGLVKIAPAAIGTTLFRPFIWEAKSPILFIASLESTIFLLFFLIMLFKIGLIRFVKIMFSDPVLLFCAVFVSTFAFAVGFSTFNFGALVRYRIPCLPLFFVLVFGIAQKAKTKKLSQSQPIRLNT